MFDSEEWSRACDAVVVELLCEAGMEGHPVDVLLLIQRLQHTLLWDASQSGRGRLMRRDGMATILLRPDERPERVQWAAAHELGESVTWRVCRALGIDHDDVLPRQREQLANELAQRILLPSRWWSTAVDRTRGNLHQLKEEFSTASYELIAWRLLDLPAIRVVTIWDHGKMTRRRCNRAGYNLQPTLSERDFWQQTHTTGQDVQQSTPIGRISVWAIHEPDWKREIVVWEPLAPDESCD